MRGLVIKNKDLLAIISPLGYTGLSYYDHFLSNSISKLKFDVYLLTSDKWILDSKQNNYHLIKIFKNCSGSKKIFLKTFNYMKSLYRISQFIKKNNIKNVHIQILELPYIDVIFFKYLKYLRCNIVYTPHDIFFNKNIPFKHFFIKILYSISNVIIVHKKQNKLDLKSNFGYKISNKTNIIPHGNYQNLLSNVIENKNINNIKKRINLNPNFLTILFFGSIKKEKGISVFLKSISDLLNIYNLDKIQFVIAGKPHDRINYNWIKSKIKNHDKFKNLIHLDLNFISEDNMTDYFLVADFVVLPYLRVSESGVLRLAQTFKKIVICSDLNEFSETIKHNENGFLFKSNCSISLSKLIIKISNKNRLELKEISSNFTQSQYDWEKVANETIKFYK